MGVCLRCELGGQVHRLQVDGKAGVFWYGPFFTFEMLSRVLGSFQNSRHGFKYYALAGNRAGSQAADEI